MTPVNLPGTERDAFIELTRLAAADEQEWRRFWSQLLPTAMQLVWTVLGPELQRSPTAEQLRMQVEALEEPDGPADSPPAYHAEAALWSAYSSFRRHFCNGDLQDARDLEQLACQLVRIAYNRWQRGRRRAGRIRTEAARGGEHPGALDTRREDPQDPSQEAERQEMIESVRKVADEVWGGFRGRDRKIVSLYLSGTCQTSDDSIAQRDIARAVGCSQATVSRVVTKFHRRVRSRLVPGNTTNN